MSMLSTLSSRAYARGDRRGDAGHPARERSTGAIGDASVDEGGRGPEAIGPA